MTKKLPKVLHITNIAALYRTSLWARLLTNKTVDYHFVFGVNKYSGIKPIDISSAPFNNNQHKIHGIKNYWLKKKYLVWQSGVLRKCLFSDANMIILLGEFNVLSNWIAALICRARGVHLVFRGHGMYGNEKGLKLFLRKYYYRLADDHLVYERRGKKVMIDNGFKANHVHIIFNSLNYGAHRQQRKNISTFKKEEIYDFFTSPNLPTIIFVGRLTKVKKLQLLLTAKKKLEENNVKCNLLLVGDGPEKEPLEKYAFDNLEPGSVHFYGSCYEDDINAALISSADVCVSPGNVGLTAIHCLSLGTPVITHDNPFAQMPESEAIESGKTGLVFEEGNVDDLALKVKKWLEYSKNKRDQIRADCYNIIDTYYNPEYQEKVILNLLNRNLPLL